MNRIMISVCVLFMLANQVFAMSPISTLVIKEAQEYGHRQAFETYARFMRPWTAFEEKAQNLSEMTEHAHIFTPYVLVAADARQKVLRSEPILVENSEKALAQYDGYLVFSVNLYTHDPSALAKLTAKLKQDKHIIPAYYISPSSKNERNVNGKPLTNGQFYLYFVDKAIQRNQPLTLLVTDGANQTRSFFFDLGKVL